MIDRNHVDLMGRVESDATEDTTPTGEPCVHFSLRVRRGLAMDGQTVLAPMFVRCRWAGLNARSQRPRLLRGTWVIVSGSLLVYQSTAMRDAQRRPSTLVEVQELFFAPEPPINAEEPAAADLNTVGLTGRLGADAEVHLLPSSTPSARFSLAVRRTFLRSQPTPPKEEPMWVRCQWTDPLAGDQQEQLTKGRWISTQGRLHIYQTAAMRANNEPPDMVVAIDKIF